MNKGFCRTLVKSINGSFEFLLPDRYNPIGLIGYGSYGAVIEAMDVKENRAVAIKKISNIIDEVDLQRILREVIILKNLKHENIISLYDVIFHQNTDISTKKIGDVYLITEKMDTDLHKVIKSNQELSEDHYKTILYQILRAIYFLHSANVVHRDIKPSNILINEDCTIKLCDFGLSRCLMEDDDDNIHLTEYVVTRYYRAPEIMLCSHHYSKKIDIWSAGCTFAELLTRKYLFPGENYLTQIELIIESLGTPREDDLNFITNSNAKNYVQSFKNISKRPFSSLVNSNDLEVLDLLEKMIVFNPDKRISIEEAMNHEYTKSIKEEGIEESVYTGTLDLSFDNDPNITREQLIERLINEIKIYDTGRETHSLNQEY